MKKENSEEQYQRQAVRFHLSHKCPRVKNEGNTLDYVGTDEAIRAGRGPLPRGDN